MDDLKPFVIAIADAELQDLQQRLAQLRWPDRLEGIGWEQGTDRDYLEALVSYWRSGFDWRAQEASLNAFCLSGPRSKFSRSTSSISGRVRGGPG